MLNMRTFGRAVGGPGVPNYEAIGQQLAAAFATSLGEKEIGFRHDASGVPSATGFMHGPNGLMRIPGVDPAVFSTMLGHEGIMSQLQWTGSRFENPLFETWTGITEASDLVRQEPCDDAPSSGMKKGCIVTAPFGWIQRGTREVDAARLSQLENRAEPLDLFVVGNPMGSSIMPGNGDNPAPTPGDWLINELSNLLSDRAIAANNDLAKLSYRGHPSNNTNGYKEFPGLQVLVNGPVGGPGAGTAVYKDALTGTLCPSMDSNVQDFAYKNIATAPNGALLVRWIAYIARYAMTIARRTQVTPVRWVWSMRETLFYELTAQWPCSYYLGGCTVVDASGQQIQLNARDTTDLRDQMRTGRFLLIDGMRWDVLLDDAIPEQSNTTDGPDVVSGSFASDIYLLPMSVMGRSTLYGEYAEWNTPAISQLFGYNFLGRIDGAWLETPRQTNSCFVLDIQVKPRLILRTPWLAAKIMNVQYSPLLHDREPFHDDPYYINGGVQGARTATDYQSHWE